MPKCSIIYNDSKIHIVKFHASLTEYLEKSGFSIIPDDRINEAAFVFVLGGDGTLLRAARTLCGLETPVIAVNMGNLGFLTEIKEEEIFSVIDDLESGNYEIDKRYFLEYELNGENNYALNDVVLAKSGIISRMISVDVFINSDYVNTYRADGVIVSTPTGSTGYSLSAGGPIVNPKLKAMVITPIAPHTLNARPIVISGNDKLTFKIPDKNADVCFMIDGQSNAEICSADSITVSMSERHINLVKPKNRSYYAVLREKLKWSTNLC
ncbi:MAG: NAD(+)/NADH kinase [Spirochaetes bacterium]|nr:NAD(+)/NADH kinase [Spirochaetota bacterium]